MSRVSNVPKEKVTKPIYFNAANPKEKEMLEWVDSKFTGFGGLVKDLLYREMMMERNGVKTVVVNTPALVEENNSSNDLEELASDYDC